MLDDVEYEKLRVQWASNPEWDKAGRVHDWRNYISEKVKSIWSTFTLEQQLAMRLATRIGIEMSPAVEAMIEGKPSVSCSHWGMFHYPSDDEARRLRSALARINQIALANA
jgi:hypothetical protein